MSADPKAWARKLVAEYESGRVTKPLNVYRTAYDALKLPFPEGKRPSESSQIVKKCSVNVKAAVVPKTPPVADAWWDDEKE
jgi:hypothetical protein